MKTVFLAVYTEAHFVELSRLLRLLRASDAYRPVIWFLYSYPAILRDVNLCTLKGWEFILSVSSLAGAKNTSGRFKEIIRRFPARLLFLAFFVRRYINQTREIRTLIKNGRSLIEQYHADLLVLCEDNVGYGTQILVKLFQMENLSTVILPYTIANATEAAEFFYDSVEHQVSANLINQMVAQRYPGWVHEHRGRKLLRLPAAMIIPMERAGYGPINPWALNGDGAAFIAVENEQMLKYYRDEKLPEDRLIVSGALYDDALAESFDNLEEMRSKLITELGLQGGLPLLICALPPSQFPRDCEFADYEEMVSFWMETLASIKGWNVVVRAHPRLTEDEVNLLLRFGLKISRWDTASLVPLCDLYVASVSATIRWAIATGKPVINYDVYQMRYRDYINVPGVLTVYTQYDFQNVLQRICSDSAYYNQIADFQKQEMAHWGILDGRSSERILKLFDDVISGRIARKTQ